LYLVVYNNKLSDTVTAIKDEITAVLNF
jgi:hypothetical protein